MPLYSYIEYKLASIEKSKPPIVGNELGSTKVFDRDISSVFSGSIFLIPRLVNSCSICASVAEIWTVVALHKYVLGEVC